MHTLLAEASDNFKAYGVTGPPPLAGNRAGLCADGGPAGEARLHAAPDADDPRHPRDAVRPGWRAAVDLQALFEKRYADEPFVDVLPAGSHPDTRSVRGANVCRIAVHQAADGDVAVVLSVIDNLVKGASGQAVQNMNIMFGLPEATGLEQVALLP